MIEIFYHLCSMEESYGDEEYSYVEEETWKWDTSSHVQIHSLKFN
jgi:hypothetical protein